jgi:hypothetical protein
MEAPPTPSLTLRERALFHQIHPLKLATDISGAFASTWLLWQHELLLGLVVGFAPSVVVTVAMLQWLDVTRLRDSVFGRYVAQHMTPLAQAVRSAGQIGIWIGAWMHVPWAIVVGIVVIILGWTYSVPSWLSREH